MTALLRDRKGASRAPRLAGALSLLLLCACGQRGELLGVIGSTGAGNGGSDARGGAPGNGGSSARGGAPGDGGADAGGGASGDGGSGGPAGGRPHFGPARAVTELNVPDAKDEDITLTADLLEIFFLSERTGSKELWTSTRSSRAEPWAPPRPVTELNTSLSEITPCVSADGLRIWFYSGGDPAGIWRATRAARGDAWSPAEPMGLVLPAGTTLAIGPALDESERLLALAVLGASNMAWDLYSATRPTADAPFSTFSPILGVNGEANEHDPFLVDGGRDLFFSSTRAGEGDLFFARRGEPGQAFTGVLALDELNTATFLESDPVVSEDKTTLFFASTRSGVADIYEAEVTSYE
jgi:hypothetical protein